MSCSIDLGRFPHNADIDTNLLASQNGGHSVILFMPNGSEVSKDLMLGIGDNIIIERPFNEDFQYSMKVLQPDGTYFVKDGNELFTFKVFINLKTCSNDDQPTDDNHSEDDYNGPVSSY